MAKLQNTITLDNGITNVVQAGDQTGETILAINKVIAMLSHDLTEIKILVDYRNSGKIEKSAYKAGLDAMKHTRFDKVAIFGASAYMSEIINAMARTVRKSRIIHFSKTRDEALEWLNN